MAAMHFFTEDLLEKEIEKLNENEEEYARILKHEYQRELEIIRRFYVSFSDMIGELSEMKKRLEGKRFFLMEEKEIDEITEKAYKYDNIKRIVEGDS